jgi:hypothetical protein
VVCGNSGRFHEMRSRVAGLAAAIVALGMLAGCHRCLVVPQGLDVDAGNNAVFEPGETVEIAPSWHYQSYSGGHCSIANQCPGSATEAMAIWDFTGPPGAGYTILNHDAVYEIPINTTRNCYSSGNCYVLSVSNPATRPASHWDATVNEGVVPSLDLSWLHPMSAAAVEAPACNIEVSSPKTWVVHIGRSFSDVPETHIFYRYVEMLFHNSITSGCGTTSYCPGNSIRRDQMAVFLLKGLHGAGYQPPVCTGTFADVPCPGPFTNWVEEVSLEGIMPACGSGTFCPQVVVTRGAMALFLLKAGSGIDYVPPAAVGLFDDVPSTDPMAPWIEELHHRGITAGCSASPLLYCPAAPNNRGQMAVFVDRTFGLRLYGP